MKDKKFKIFSDFDGTIAKKDVGAEIFKKFLDKNVVSTIVDDLLSGRISSRECWEKLCKSAPFMNKEELDNFILSQEVEPSLHGFIDYCEKKGYEVYILSDGFDYYIDRILKRENLGHLKVYSNKLILSDEGKLLPSFPFYSDDCRSSANCKRNHVLANSSEEDYTVFIGDGSSDFDAIQYVDFIFAKDDLLKYCESNRITFFPFKNFDDVVLRIDQLASGKRLKKRYRAELKRREAFIIE
jgi:2-hydroxy-3-keto-5-methylthiopentenyl-1-phosphate phosphatase